MANNYKQAATGWVLDELSCVLCDNKTLDLLKDKKHTKYSVLYCKNILYTECKFVECQYCNTLKQGDKQSSRSKTNINQ